MINLSERQRCLTRAPRDGVGQNQFVFLFTMETCFFQFFGTFIILWSFHDSSSTERDFVIHHFFRYGKTKVMLCNKTFLPHPGNILCWKIVVQTFFSYYGIFNMKSWTNEILSQTIAFVIEKQTEWYTIKPGRHSMGRFHAEEKFRFRNFFRFMEFSQVQIDETRLGRTPFCSLSKKEDDGVP